MQFFGYLRRNSNDRQDSDYTGYDFWLTKLNQFNGDFVNAEVVTAFINSSEISRQFGQVIKQAGYHSNRPRSNAVVYKKKGRRYASPIIRYR